MLIPNVKMKGTSFWKLSKFLTCDRYITCIIFNLEVNVNMDECKYPERPNNSEFRSIHNEQVPL